MASHGADQGKQLNANLTRSGGFAAGATEVGAKRDAANPRLFLLSLACMNAAIPIDLGWKALQRAG